MSNKISVVLDLATDKAVSGLKGFKQSVNDADGAVGKFKAGASSAFESVKAHASQLALAGGAALVAFAAKGVTAFTGLALEAGKFRDVSGASLDEASKWIAVGDDIGVSGDQISSAWNKMNIAIGAGKPLLKDYGIELQKTADGQVDANATFLHAIDVINGIQDPTKKAEVAAATFGKGWTSMSELIEQGSETITASMAEVSDAQIIDDAELAKAKKFRESMDKLKDSVEDAAMQLGEELTPAISVVADALSDIAPAMGGVVGGVVGGFVKMADAAYDAGQSMAEFIDMIPGLDTTEPIDLSLHEIRQLERGIADLVGQFSEGAPTMAVFADRLEAAGVSGTELSLAINEYKSQQVAATAATADGSMGLDELTEATDASTLATDMASFAIDAKKRSDEAAKDAAEAHTEAINDQIDAMVDLVGGELEVAASQRDAAAAVAELNEAMKEGDLSAEELTASIEGTALVLRDTATDMANFDADTAAANGTILTAAERSDLFRDKLIQIASTLEPGSPLRMQLDAWIDDLNRIPTSIETRVFLTGSGAGGTGQGPIRVGNAAGTSNWRGGVTLVGEQGPELVDLPAGSAIHPAGETAQMLNGSGGGGGGLTVNINGGLIDQRTLEQLSREWDRWKRGLS